MINEPVGHHINARAARRAEAAKVEDELRKAIAANEAKLKESRRNNPNWGKCPSPGCPSSVLTYQRRSWSACSPASTTASSAGTVAASSPRPSTRPFRKVITTASLAHKRGDKGSTVQYSKERLRNNSFGHSDSRLVTREAAEVTTRKDQTISSICLNVRSPSLVWVSCSFSG